MVLEEDDALLVARQFAILATQLDEALLVLEEAGRDDVRLMLEMASFLRRCDERPAQETG